MVELFLKLRVLCLSFFLSLHLVHSNPAIHRLLSFRGQPCYVVQVSIPQTEKMWEVIP